MNATENSLRKHLNLMRAAVNVTEVYYECGFAMGIIEEAERRGTMSDMDVITWIETFSNTQRIKIKEIYE